MFLPYPSAPPSPTGCSIKTLPAPMLQLGLWAQRSHRLPPPPLCPGVARGITAATAVRWLCILLPHQAFSTTPSPPPALPSTGTSTSNKGDETSGLRMALAQGTEWHGWVLLPWHRGRAAGCCCCWGCLGLARWGMKGENHVPCVAGEMGESLVSFPF